MAKSIGILVRRHGPAVAALTPCAIIVLLMVVPLSYWSASIIGRDDAAVVPPHAIFWSVFPRTAALSALAAGTAIVLGGSVAFLYVFSAPTAQRWMTLMMVVPLLVGYLARNYSWLGLLSAISNQQTSAPFQALGNMLLYSSVGVVVVTATVFVPFAFFLTLQGFSAIRDELLASARTLGCSAWTSVRVVIAPLVARQFAVAFGLCFVLALGYFVTPQMIGGGNHNFVGNESLRLLAKPGDVTAASWVALDLFLSSLLPITLIVWYSAKRRKVVLGS